MTSELTKETHLFGDRRVSDYGSAAKRGAGTRRSFSATAAVFGIASVLFFAGCLRVALRDFSSSSALELVAGGSGPELLATTIKGLIFCDNTFEFYFNGKLVAVDPLSFTPHQAVEVEFEYDGTSPKHYAIKCTDYGLESGFEYVKTNESRLGDGSLIATFDDGTTTHGGWSMLVTNHGPTDASFAAGCSKFNLDACVVEDYGEPPGWYEASFDFSHWDLATEYSEATTGWGRQPSWSAASGCCQPLNPITMAQLECCSCNYDLDSGLNVAVSVAAHECIDPLQTNLANNDDVAHIWAPSLLRDNGVLFRYTGAPP